MNKSFFAWPLLALLAACGASDPGPLPVNHSPVIADPGPISTPEFTQAVTKLTVSDAEGNAVKLTLSGVDAAAFSISNDGSLRFALPPDFQTPADANHDNVYLVTVTADDTYSTPATVALTITVTACPPCRVAQVSAHVTTDDTTFVSQNILTSFEYPALMQQQTNLFTLTGVFATATNWNTLEFGNASLAPVAARIGNASVSTCEITGIVGDCDNPQGSITINDFTVTKDSITFLMSGGNGGPDVGVEAILASSGALLGTYNPNSCGEPVLKGDQDYVNFDTSDLVGEKIRLTIFDRASHGCGFIAFDHFYQTDKPRGVVGAVLTKPLLPVNVTLDAPAAIKLIPRASFENPVDMVAKRGWVATGDFANPTDTSWQGTTVNVAAAHVGDKAISTCEMNGNSKGCDASTGTLTSPAFKVTDTYLDFLMHGGGTGNTGLRVLDTFGNVLHKYSPATCSPSYIQNNDDWTHINISALNGAYVKAQLFDEEPNGCGFISTDHWYQSPNAWNPSGNGKDGGTVTLTVATAAGLGFNVTLGADALTQVIGDFDDATVSATTWTPTGDFASPATADAWQGTSGVAHVGLRAVSTCEMNHHPGVCDAPKGTLTSPAFTVVAARPFLNFLMAGGNPAGTVGLKVLSVPGGAMLASFAPNTCGPSYIDGDNDWQTLDLTAQVGTQVQVQIYDNESGGCGFVSFDHLYMSATRKH